MYCVRERRGEYTVWVGKPEGMRPLGKHRQNHKEIEK
jgi:hypothetical protein